MSFFSSFSSQSYAGAGRKSGSVILDTSTAGGRISTCGYGLAEGGGVGATGGFFASGYGSAMLEHFTIDEKLTMQNLNDRLATYLAKVRALEKTNSQLELQIRELYQKRTPAATTDLGAYWKTIHDLRTQISAASLACAKVLVQMQRAEMDTRHFRTNPDEGSSFSSTDAARPAEFLQRFARVLPVLHAISPLSAFRGHCPHFLAALELKSLRSQLRGTVTVDVDSAPGADLTKVLDEMRERYELMVAKNQKEAEAWFREQSATIQKSVATNTQLVGTEEVQLNAHRRTLQTLEIDCQSLLSMKASLERNLPSVRRFFAEELHCLSRRLEQREAELAQILAGTQRQCDEYAQLLNVKSRLEAEIATYRRLLEGEDFRYSTEIQTVETDKQPEVVTRKKIITITETLVDGQVVESHQEVKESTT